MMPEAPPNNRRLWVIGGLVAAGGLVYIYIRNKQNAAGGSNASGSSLSSTPYGVPQSGSYPATLQPLIIPGTAFGGPNNSQNQQGSTNTSAAPTPTPAGTPSTSMTPAFNPYPVGQTVAPNEQIVSSAYDPSGQGGWDLTNLGGVYTFGNAPFYGSSFNPKGNFGSSAIVASPGGGYQINTPTGITRFGP